MTALYERLAGNNLAAPVVFLALFLVIVGGALYLTPRIARWIEGRQKKNPGFYEGMLTEDPNAPEKAGEDGGDAAGSTGKETGADAPEEDRHGTD